MVEGFNIGARTVISEDEILLFIDNLRGKGPKCDEAIQFLRNICVQRYLKYNLDKYCKVILLVLNEVSASFEFVEALRSEELFRRGLIEKDEFYLPFFELLLAPLIDLGNKFSDESVFEELSQLIQRCIFKNKTKTFHSYFNGEKQTLCKTFVKFLSSLYSQSENRAKYGFKLILHAFARSCNNFGFIYEMFILLTELLGFQVIGHFSLQMKIKAHEATLSKSLVILNEMFDVLTKLKVDPESKLNEISFTDFIRDLLQTLMSLDVVCNDYCYKILINTIEINPLLVESMSDEIIIYAMLCDDHKMREYEEMMVKILEVYAKLHRIQKFVSKMIPTLRENFANPTVSNGKYLFVGNLGLPKRGTVNHGSNIMFPKRFLSYFSECIVHLASWQIINLLKTLLFHLHGAVAESIADDSSMVYIEMLSILTCCLLASVRMAEHTVASSTTGKFVEGLEELKDILKKFGINLLHQEHNQILMRAYLNICYNWAEIYMIMTYYSINNEVDMKRVTDNDPTPCNLTYLHSYLTAKQWCSIFERISNFGEKPCKEIMQKLIFQKLRASLIFGNKINDEGLNPVIKDLTANLEHISTEILLDKFVVNNILVKIPTDSMVNLSEIILKEIMKSEFEISEIFDNERILSGLLTTIFTKINQLLKQKRKIEGNVRKAFFCRIIAALPSALFLDDLESNLEEIPQIFSSEEQNLDLKINQEKLEDYLNALKRLQIIFCSQQNQKLIVLLLMALQKDIITSNCDKILKDKCENVVVGIMQSGRFTLFDIFEPVDFIKVLISYFENYEELFSDFVNKLLKSEESVYKFAPGIDFIKDNLKNDKILKCASILLNLLHKTKKSKLSTEAKEACLKYKSRVCEKIVKISTENPEHQLVEPYALALKNYLNKDENGNLEKLKGNIENYVKFCLSQLKTESVKGGLMLFTTVLHNKALMSKIGDSFILDVWESLKTVTIPEDSNEAYSQLVILLSSLISNEQLSKILGDLLNVSELSIEDGNYDDLFKHLKMWSSIISTNFNPIKTKNVHEQLERLLHKLTALLKSVENREDVLTRITQFEVAIVQTSHFTLTSPMVDIFLLTVALIMMEDDNFVLCYGLCISMLENLLKHRNPLIMDRLPPYLQQYRILLRELCARSNSNNANEESVQKFADCAHQLEKLTRNLVACTRDMTRISLYLIADILEQYETVNLFPNVKVHINNCIYSLISLCDQHAVQYLMRVLSNASTELFKIMYENYKKYYRFTGKV